MAFIYADQVPAQQAVQYATLKAQEQGQRAQVLRDIAQQGIAQQNAAAQRAMTQAQMSQQTSEAERERQARALETDKRITSQEKVAGMDLETRKAEISQKGKFSALASLIDSDDPPTDSEFNRLTQGLDDDSILQLKTALDQKRNALKAIAEKAKQTADYWNSIFDDVKVGEDTKFALSKAKFAEWEKGEKDSRNLIERDPKFTFRFMPKYKGPRMDAPAPPATGAIPSAVTPIADLFSPGFSGGVPSRSGFLGRPMPSGLIQDEPPKPIIDPYSRPRFEIPSSMY